MADNILFKSGLASKLNDITKTAGQLLFAIDGTSGSIYLDKDSTTRIKMNLDATKLQNAKTINGTAFDGTKNITTTKWGSKRTVTISDNDGTNTQANANVDGSANFTLKLPATIKATLSGKASTAGHADTASSATTAASCTGNAATATKLLSAKTLIIGNTGKSFDGSSNIAWSLNEIGASYAHADYWDFSVSSHSNYVTFDVNSPTGGPGGWVNGFVTTHSSYLSSYLVNVHRSSDWYVGYSEHIDTVSTNPTWYKLLHSGNYTDYTVTKTGSGASGTWGINVTGSAGSVAWGNITGKPSFNYLPLSGGRLSGLLSAHGGISLNDSTPRETPQFILGIRAFADGGNIVWQEANQVSVGNASALTPITTIDKADSTNHWRRVWFSYIDNATGRPAYDDRFVFQTSTGTLKAPVFSGNKLYASSTDSDAIHTIGGILASHLRIDNADSGGWVELREDGEGGTIDIVGPNGSKLWEIDCYNSSDLRIFSHDGSNYQFFVFGANGNLSAPSFSGSLNGNASTASALTPINATDQAGNMDTWRRIWMCWSDNATGRPAYDDRFAIQTSTGTLKAPIFSGDLNGNASSASLLYPDSSFSYYRNSFQYFNFSGVAGAAVGVNDTPTSQWWHILRHSHWNGDKFYTDVAIPFNNNHIYYKRVMAGSVQNGGWVMVYDTQNIVYSASAPSGPLVGTIWLQPI